MILFALQALICALCVIGLLYSLPQTGYKKTRFALVIGLPVASLGTYLILGNPHLPSASVLFETEESRVMRFLQTQDPKILEQLKNQIENKITE